MASQSQGIQQLLQAEKRAAEKVSEARKRELRGGAARRGVGAEIVDEAPKLRRGGVVTVAEACESRSCLDVRLRKACRPTGSCDVG